MALKRIQINSGPAFVDLINVVQGNDLDFQLNYGEDITDSNFEAKVLSSRDGWIADFTVSGIFPLISGIIAMSISASGTSLFAPGSTWYLDEVTNEGRKTIYAGNIELYYK
jgi:hypothetical protein